MVSRPSNFIPAWQGLGGRVILTTMVPWQAGRFYQIPTQEALVFAKDSYDAFTNAALVHAQEEMHSRYIIVAGVIGDGCVMASICGGFSLGYHQVIARDLIETTDIGIRYPHLS
jgi:nicotinamidase-related amidase